jgi:manganese/zinc/iron transport system substrate-binding protein
MFRMLKRFFVVLLLFAVATGCSKRPTKQSGYYEDNQKIKVLSTIAMIDDLVGRIGGDRIDHISLISGEIDPHSYELVKGDDEKITTADVLFYNGLNLEHGASLCYKLQKHPQATALGNDVLEKHPELILRTENTLDPHLWMDISSWIYVIDPIVASLAAVDPEGKEYYIENASILRLEMLSVHEKIYNLIQSVPEEKRFLVTSHDAFGYFARTYLATPEERENGSWNKRFKAPEGLAPDGQLSARDIQCIMDHLLAHDIDVVFAESNVSQDSLKKIISASREKKHEVHFSQRVLYGDAMGSYDDPVSSYLEMIEKNAQSLLREWE